jgi:hypothetical protein
MRHNHEERVHSYLKKLNEEEAERLKHTQQPNQANQIKLRNIQVEDAEKMRGSSAVGRSRAQGLSVRIDNKL